MCYVLFSAVEGRKESASRKKRGKIEATRVTFVVNRYQIRRFRFYKYKKIDKKIKFEYFGGEK